MLGVFRRDTWLDLDIEDEEARIDAPLIESPNLNRRLGLIDQLTVEAGRLATRQDCRNDVESVDVAVLRRWHMPAAHDRAQLGVLPVFRSALAALWRLIRDNLGKRGPALDAREILLHRPDCLTGLEVSYDQEDTIVGSVIRLEVIDTLLEFATKRI